MSEEEDDATIQMDVSAIQEMYGSKASTSHVEPPVDDGTTQIDRAEIDRLIASERVDRSTMMGYAVGPLSPLGLDGDGTTEINRAEIDALIRSDQVAGQPAGAPDTPRRKPDPTQMVDRRAIELLQSRDEEHALAYQFEMGEFSEVSEPYEEVSEPNRRVPTLENPPVSSESLGATVPVAFDSPFAGFEGARKPEPIGLVPTLGAGSSPVGAIRPAPVTMPSSISADLAPLLEPTPEVASGLDADALFSDLGPMTPFDAPVVPPEPTQDLATSGLVFEEPRARKGSVWPYVIGVLMVLFSAGVGVIGYLLVLAD